MTQKVVSVIEMTFLYAAQYSFILQRPKIEAKLSTQSADKWICMGKWPVPSGGNHFHHVAVVRLVPGFFNDYLLANSSLEYSKKTFFERAGTKKKL